MNLIGDAWIPVAWKGGSGGTVGLREAFERGDEIRDLALGPPQRIAVMRLLICIAQAALDGPADEKAWKTCRGRIVRESVRYLAKWRASFDLEGKRAFMQTPDLVPTDGTPLSKLDFGLATGNNHVLFEGSDVPGSGRASPGKVAVNLLTFQCFSPSGTIGETKWAGKKTGRSSEHAPCIEGSPLMTLLRGGTLLSAVHMNLLCKDQLRIPFGRPIWEARIKGPASPAAKRLVKSYLGRLVPLSRGMRLTGDGLTLTLANGLQYPKLPVGRDTMATVVKTERSGEETHVYVRIDPSRHPWRELGSVLAYRDRGRDATGGPPALRHLRSHPSKQHDLWVGGIATYATKTAKFLDTAEWVLTVPEGMTDDAALEAYAAGVEFARKREVSLKIAVGNYCAALKVDAAGARRSAVEAYWSRLDGRPAELVRAVESPSRSLDGWRRTVRQVASAAYRSACPHTTPRQIQAFAAGRAALRRSAGKGDKE